MARISEPASRQRRRPLAAQDGMFSNSDLLFPRRPRITYGKKNSTPFSLTGKQFRRDVYTIPSDDESQEDQQESSPDSFLQVSGNRGKVKHLDLPLVAQRPVRVSERSSRVSASRLEHRIPREGAALTSPSRLAKLHGKGGPKPVKTPKRKPEHQQKSMQETRDGPIEARKKVDPTKQEAQAKAKLSTPARRLPVNELFLVTSPLDATYYNDHESTCYEAQDPIHDRTSSPQEGRSPLSNDESASTSRLVPLSAFRSRLKTPKSWNKTPKRLSKGQRTTSIFDNIESEPRGRDGFEDFELVVNRRPKRFQKCAHGKTELPIAGFSALQLKSGPLPDVEFEPSPAELRLKTQTEHRGDSCSGVDDTPVLSFESPWSRVSFQSREQQDFIRAQLSSISAPARVASESSDEESDVDEDEGLEDESSDVEQHADDRNDLVTTVSPPNVPNNDASTKYHQRKPIQELEQDKRGVTLDFRQPALPGQLPSQTLGKRNLVEVNEAIIEVPESEFLPDNNMLPNNRYATAEPAYPQEARPRSILKNSSTQIVPDTTTRPEHTQANTRRNSMILEGEESRYFADASNVLQAPNQRKHQFVPRRGSSYFFPPERNSDADVEMLDSTQAIAETSLPYTIHSEGAMQTSSIDLPRVPPRDLKTLTRSVSQEFETLSQSARRQRSGAGFRVLVKVT